MKQTNGTFTNAEGETPVAHEDERFVFRQRKHVLILSAIATCVGIVIELVASIASGSLALQSDALHMVSDLVVLGVFTISWVLAQRPATPRRPYGFRRTEVLGTFVSGLLLWTMGILILAQAGWRFFNPVEPEGAIMLGAATVGLVINVATAWWVHRANAGLTGRGLLRHLMSDSLSSAGVVLGGLAILLFGWHVLDPLIGVAIAGAIFWYAWGLVRDTADILLEAIPSRLDLDAVNQEIRALHGVTGVHRSSIHTMGFGLLLLNAHIQVIDQQVSRTEELKVAIEGILEKYGITCGALQFEVTSADEHRYDKKGE